MFYLQQQDICFLILIVEDLIFTNIGKIRMPKIKINKHKSL